jgi:transcriptional regulator with XRE-family HTH domain
MNPAASMPEAASPRPAEPLPVRLRRERERRRIALSSISANTKISASLFESLERGDVSRWPSGIFRRAFIRAYAQAIGLDPEATAREFLEQFPDPLEPPAPASPAPKESALAKETAAPSTAGSTVGEPVLRLKLADTGPRFAAGRVLAGMRQRWAAAACDAVIVLTIALGVYLALDTFWLPLGVVMLGYYLGGILLLGNTPGVCLWAPGGAIDSHYNRPSNGHHAPADTAPGAHSPWRFRVPAR